MVLEDLSASMKTRSKESSGPNFANDSAAGPTMMLTWLSTPAVFKFSRAAFRTDRQYHEKLLVPVVCCIPLRNVGIVQG
jgi:hypothetical protein